METKSMKQHMGMRAANTISNTIIHVLLVIISVIWLIPFVCIVLQSLRVESTWQVGYILPKQWGLDNFKNLLNTNFPKWYLNTFIIAVVAAALQTIIVLCMSYTLSRFRFKLRKPLMKFMLILGLFPGMLTMIILYRVLKDLGLTQANAVPGLILVYIASSGMGYYVSKGFFDTIPKSLDEAARIDGEGLLRHHPQVPGRGGPHRRRHESPGALEDHTAPRRFHRHLHPADRVHGPLGRLRVRQLHLLRQLVRHERGRRYVQLADA